MKTRRTLKKSKKSREIVTEEMELQSVVGLLYGQFTLQQIAEYASEQTLKATETAFKKQKHIE